MKVTGFSFAVFALCPDLSSAASVAGILEQHNVYRCMHNSDPVSYSSSLEVDAQAYADELAQACVAVVDDETLDGASENIAYCALSPEPGDTCSSGYDATPRWYAEVSFYVEDPDAGYSTDPSETTSHFTQIVWNATSEIGCASSTCTISLFEVTYVVCRYQAAGNVAGQYIDNVEGAASKTFDECSELVGGNGDPHMSGFKGQRFDFTGKDDTWYALVHDLDIAINMRITAPVPDVHEITYITGLGLSLMGTDSIMHTVEIIIDNPHDLNPTCGDRNGAPCLADGALTVMVDNKHVGAGEFVKAGTRLEAVMIFTQECESDWDAPDA